MSVTAQNSNKHVKLFPEVVFSGHSFVCAKCTVLSDIATISPLTNTSDGTMFENLPLMYNNLLLLPLNIISYSVA